MSTNFENDLIQELLFQIDSNQFSTTDREAYVIYDDDQYGFIAPVVNGAMYVSVSEGTLPQNGIPVSTFEDAFYSGKVQFFSSKYDPVGRQLYDAPLLIWYRTLGDYSFEYPYNNDNFIEYSDYWYPYLYDYYPLHFAYSSINSRSYYPVANRDYVKFGRIRGRRNHLPMRSTYRRYNLGNFQNTFHGSRTNISGPRMGGGGGRMNRGGGGGRMGGGGGGRMGSGGRGGRMGGGGGRTGGGGGRMSGGKR